jgi:hypothetical protein
MRIREKRHLQAVDPNAGVPILQAEKPLWQGSPSLLGMIPLLRNWGFVLAALVAWTHGWTPWGSPGFARLAPWLVHARWFAAIPLWHVADRLLSLRFLRYELTNEHIRIRRGILTHWTEEYELAAVAKIVLREPWLLRRVGRSDVILYPVDPQVQPVIELLGVRDGAWLRQRVHALLRQGGAG